MRNSRKQSHHCEVSLLLMRWVIWERQCGSKAKEPAGIQKAKVWPSVTAAALETPGRRLPFSWPQILPRNTGLNALKSSPRDVKPGMPYVVVQMVPSTAVSPKGVIGGWNVVSAPFINLGTLLYPPRGRSTFFFPSFSFFWNLPKGTVWAIGGPIRSNVTLTGRRA